MPFIAFLTVRIVLTLTVLMMVAISQAFAWPDSFDKSADGYHARRVPVMQRGAYQPSPNAPVAQAIPGEGDGSRSCCRSNGTPRWYVGFTGFLVYLDDQDVELSPVSFLNKPKTIYTTKLGYGWGANVGYRITPEIRAEFEFARRESDTDKVIVTNPIPPGTVSSQRSTSYMANVYYDFINSTSYIPYLGAGLGMSKVNAPIYYVAGGQSTMLKEWTMSYQFMAGISYKLDLDLNPIVFNFGYRYFTGQDMEVNINGSNGAKATYFNDSHNLELGGRFYF
jgi:opacity protein-like surface antigen